MNRHFWLAAFSLAGIAAMSAAQAQSPSPQAQAAGQAALVKFVIKDNAIPASLTGRPGNPEEGRKVAVSRQLGNCLACHQISALAHEPFHGNTGPSLDGVANRMSEGEMRLRLVDSTKVNPQTLMPAFYRVEGLTRVAKRFQGKPVLTAEQIEDVIAFLKTLK